MATERDPEHALATLRAWRREDLDQPIIAVYSPATTTTDTTWIFYQGNREGHLEVTEEAVRLLQQRGHLVLRRDGPEDTLRAYPA